MTPHPPQILDPDRISGVSELYFPHDCQFLRVVATTTMAAEATRIESTSSAALKQQGEYGYPNGHLGHLTKSQGEALEKFRKLVTEKGIYEPATADTPPSHDDITLL